MFLNCFFLDSVTIMEHSTSKRLAKIYSIDEAQLIFDEIPSDGEITDEESDEESDIIPSHELPFELLSSLDESAPEFLVDPPDTKISTLTSDQESVLDAPGSSVPGPATISRSKKIKPKSSTVSKETANVKPRSWKKKTTETMPSLFEGQQGNFFWILFLAETTNTTST